MLALRYPARDCYGAHATTCVGVDPSARTTNPPPINAARARRMISQPPITSVAVALCAWTDRVWLS